MTSPIAGKSLAKGEKAAMSGTRARVQVWSATPGAIDLIVVLQTGSGRVRSDADMVFFNNPNAPGVALTPTGAVEVDLATVPADIDRVVIAASTEAQNLTFGAVGTVSATVHGKPDSFLFEPPGLNSETLLLMVAFYRRGGAWKIDAIGQGYAAGLAAFATESGVTVEGEQAPVPAHGQPMPPKPDNVATGFGTAIGDLGDKFAQLIELSLKPGPMPRDRTANVAAALTLAYRWAPTDFNAEWVRSTVRRLLLSKALQTRQQGGVRSQEEIAWKAILEIVENLPAERAGANRDWSSGPVTLQFDEAVPVPYDYREGLERVKSLLGGVVVDDAQLTSHLINLFNDFVQDFSSRMSDVLEVLTDDVVATLRRRADFDPEWAFIWPTYHGMVGLMAYNGWVATSRGREWELAKALRENNPAAIRPQRRQVTPMSAVLVQTTAAATRLRNRSRPLPVLGETAAGPIVAPGWRIGFSVPVLLSKGESTIGELMLAPDGLIHLVHVHPKAHALTRTESTNPVIAQRVVQQSTATPDWRPTGSADDQAALFPGSKPLMAATDAVALLISRLQTM